MIDETAAIQEIARLKSQMTILEAQILGLTTERDEALAECAPTIPVEALLAAGLTAWGERAITDSDPSQNILMLVVELHRVACEPRSLTQCDRVKNIFGEICMRSGATPTQDESLAMQTILDNAKIAHKWINFIGVIPI